MKTKLFLCALLLAAASNVHAGAVVASADSTYSAMDIEQVKRVFLGRETSVDGKPVTLVFQKGGAVRDQFDNQVLGRPGAQLTSYWSKLIFTGKAKAPDEASNDADVVAKLAANPNAIGYVSDAAVSGKVKVLYKF